MGLKPRTTGFGLEPGAVGNSSEPEVWWLAWCWERPGAWGQRGWPGLALGLDAGLWVGTGDSRCGGWPGMGAHAVGLLLALW